MTPATCGQKKEKETDLTRLSGYSQILPSAYMKQEIDFLLPQGFVPRYKLLPRSEQDAFPERPRPGGPKIKFYASIDVSGSDWQVVEYQMSSSNQ